MFERGVVTDNKKRHFEVIVTLEDGRVERGTCAGAGSSLAEILAAAAPFLELTDPQGRTAFFAKTSIRKIESSDMPSADQLRTKERAVQNNNPYQILGIEADVDEAGLSEAYRQLSKAYHPDRLTGLGMPREIVEYAAAMQRRINIAFDEVSTILKRNAAAAAQPAAGPVFERRPAWAAKQAS